MSMLDPMTTIDLKGMHRVVRRYPRSVRIDLYSLRGKGAAKLGSYKAANEAAAQALVDANSAKIAAKYEAALVPTTGDLAKFKGVLRAYKQSPAWKTKLSDGTRKVWRPWLDRIEDVFGEVSTPAMGRTGARKLIIDFRNKYEDTPRAADMAMQVMSRVLNWALDLELIERNPAAKIESLWEADWSEFIWEDEHFLAFAKAAREANRAHLVDAVLLMAHTGLRVSDAASLTWDAVNFDAGEIRWKTSKSRKKRAAVIPMTSDLRKVLRSIPRKGDTILVSAKGRAYATGGTLSEAIQEICDLAGFERRTHDLRGTAATYYALAGLDKRIIARILGWSEKQVEKILELYVDVGRLSRETARKINAERRKRGNGSRNGSAVLSPMLGEKPE